MFQKLPEMPKDTIVMNGRAKLSEVAQYFSKYSNSMHKLHGWVDIRKNPKNQSKEANEENMKRLFTGLSDDQRCAVFKLSKTFTLYLIPLDRLSITEDFRLEHNIQMYEVDDGEGPPEKATRFMFVTLIKAKTTQNCLNPLQVHAVPETEPEPAQSNPTYQPLSDEEKEDDEYDPIGPTPVPVQDPRLMAPPVPLRDPVMA